MSLALSETPKTSFAMSHPISEGKKTADQLKIQLFNIRIYHKCEGRTEKSVPRITDDKL